MMCNMYMYIQGRAPMYGVTAKSTRYILLPLKELVSLESKHASTLCLYLSSPHLYLLLSINNCLSCLNSSTCIKCCLFTVLNSLHSFASALPSAFNSANLLSANLQICSLVSHPWSISTSAGSNSVSRSSGGMDEAMERSGLLLARLLADRYIVRPLVGSMTNCVEY